MSKGSNDSQYITMGLNEAAEYLGAHKETVRRLAFNGKIPATKVGRSWLFLKQDLVAYIRSKYAGGDASQGVTVRGMKQWHSSKEMKHGGSTSLIKEARIRKTTGTLVKKDAQKVHDLLKSNLWTSRKLETKPEMSWLDAVTRWLKKSVHKRSIDMDRLHLQWLDPYLRASMLSDISSEQIEFIAQEKETTGVAPASVNRLLEIIRAILNRAHKEWGWIEHVPAIRMRKVENKRVRWLKKEQAKRLLFEVPLHLEAMAEFTLLTGLRESNVTQLKWEQVDLKRQHALIHPEQSKTRKAIAVPLSRRAIRLLDEQRGKHSIYVFTYNGSPVSRCNNHAWRKALKRAGISDFRWHDLRHTWASWHVQSGTSLHELQQLGGWSNYEMVLRYAHLSSEHLKVAAERIYDTK